MQAKREPSESRYSDTSIKPYSPYGRSLHVLTTRGRHYAYRVPYNWPSNPRAEAAIVYRHSAWCAIVARVVFEINPQPSAPFPVWMTAVVESVHPTIHPARLGAVNALYVVWWDSLLRSMELNSANPLSHFHSRRCAARCRRELFNYVNGPTCILFETSSRATSRWISRGHLLSIKSLPGHFKSAHVHCARIAAWPRLALLDLCTVARPVAGTSCHTGVLLHRVWRVEIAQLTHNIGLYVLQSFKLAK